MKLYEDLLNRNLIDNISSEELINKLNNEKLTFYLGTDPTADSLHIGHYCVFAVAKRLASAGHNPIILVGGSTGLIGDPRPSSERPMITKETLEYNYNALRKQVGTLIPNATFVNNLDWTKEINVLDFLRDFGKYYTVNYMLSKDTVKSRLDVGISYTEFSYMILQGLDYNFLYNNYNCTLQIGGSDQWGNMVSGLDLIKKISNKDNDANIFTIPLITKKDGTKFGKSEGGAIWLDKNKTSSYELYQFLINVEDEKVIEYLKKLTFLSLEEINKIEENFIKEPEKREAQRILAKEIIVDLHGAFEYDSAVKISKSLFSGEINKLSEIELIEAFKNIDNITINEDVNILDLLILSKSASSKREAKEFVSAGSISINGNKETDIEKVITKNDTLYNKYIVIRRGKKKYTLAILN